MSRRAKFPSQQPATARGSSARAPSPSSPVSGAWQHRDWIFALLLLAATLLVYQPAWHGQPVWDDDGHMTRPELRSWEGLGRIWTELGATQQYYPLVHSAFWAQHRLWGNATWGYHWVNILLHVAGALLFLQVLRRLQLPGAWLAAAVFALHPVHVESVAWISELKNTLSAVFFLGAALAYLRFDRTRAKGAYALAFGLFVLGLLSKTVIATLPAALLVVFWWKRGRLSWKGDVLPLAPFLVIGAAAGLFTAWVEREFIGAAGATFAFSFPERLLIAGRALWFYLGKLFWPAHLAFVYPRWAISASVWWQLLFPLAGLGLIVGLWFLRRRWRAPLAAVLLFSGILFPALGFFNAYPFRYSFVADHFQYLASLPIIALVSVAVALRLGRLRPAGRWAGAALCAAMVLVLGGLTWRQSAEYADAETLWRSTIEKNPDAFLAHNNLGNLLLHRGDPDTAMVHFRKAVEIEPANAEPYNNLGTALMDKGDPAQAVLHLQKALELNPRSAEAHYNLGNAFARLNRTDEAMAQFQAAVECNPRFVEARNNLGHHLLDRGDVGEAVRAFEEVVEMAPEFFQARYNLGSALFAAGRIPEATVQFEKAVAARPDFAQAYGNLGHCYVQQGRPADALAAFLKVIQLQPENPDAYGNLGNLLLQARRMDEAIACYRKAVELKPSYSEAWNNLGNALLEKGDADGALAAYRRALEIQPDYADAHNNLGAALWRAGRAQEAVAHFEKALGLRPDYIMARRNLAWILATYPGEEVRNGPRAVEVAREADRLAGGADPVILGTLAAAHAEAGQFDEAIAVARRALQAAEARSIGALQNALQVQIKLYEAGVPFRDIEQDE